VDEMIKLLFSLSRDTLKETLTKYTSKAPGSFTSPFTDGVVKTEAVKALKNENRRLVLNSSLVV